MPEFEKITEDDESGVFAVDVVEKTVEKFFLSGAAEIISFVAAANMKVAYYKNWFFCFNTPVPDKIIIFSIALFIILSIGNLGCTYVRIG